MRPWFLLDGIYCPTPNTAKHRDGSTVCSQAHQTQSQTQGRFYCLLTSGFIPPIVLCVYSTHLKGEKRPGLTRSALQLRLLSTLPSVCPVLGLEPPEKGVMRIPHRKPWEGFWPGDRFLHLVAGALIGLPSLAVYWLAFDRGRSLPGARTIVRRKNTAMNNLYKLRKRLFVCSLFLS